MADFVTEVNQERNR